MVTIYTQDQIKNELGETRFSSANPTRCYRKINLPINVEHGVSDIDTLRKGVTSNKEIIIKNELLDSSFCSFLDSLGLEVCLSRLFINAPGHEYNRHVDKRDINDQTVALNFPFEDEGATFSWYNLSEDGVLTLRPNGNGIPVYYFDPKQCNEVLNTEIHHEYNQPILLNTGYIHSVIVGNTNRYCFSYFLKRKDRPRFLQWDDAVEILAPYITQS